MYHTLIHRERTASGKSQYDIRLFETHVQIRVARDEPEILKKTFFLEQHCKRPVYRGVVTHQGEFISFLPVSGTKHIWIDWNNSHRWASFNIYKVRTEEESQRRQYVYRSILSLEASYIRRWLIFAVKAVYDIKSSVHWDSIIDFVLVKMKYLISRLIMSMISFILCEMHSNATRRNDASRLMDLGRRDRILRTCRSLGIW